MKTITTETKQKIGQLLVVLDRDIDHISLNLARLDRLRGFVVKRDDISLAAMLEEIRTHSDSYQANEKRRQHLREELAQAFGFSVERMTLSNLEKCLADSQSSQVSERRTRLKGLTENLRNEYTATASLLADCTRFNRMSLDKLFNSRKTGTVQYDSRGSARKQTDAALINIKF